LTDAAEVHVLEIPAIRNNDITPRPGREPIAQLDLEARS
jgi:hypothetical protein